MSDRPDVVIVMTDQERAVPPYEDDEVLESGVYYVRLSPEPAASEGLALGR